MAVRLMRSAVEILTVPAALARLAGFPLTAALGNQQPAAAFLPAIRRPTAALAAAPISTALTRAEPRALSVVHRPAAARPRRQAAQVTALAAVLPQPLARHRPALMALATVLAAAVVAQV